VRDLVIAIMALALAAVVAVGGIGYVNIGIASRVEASAAAAAGFRIYGGALTAYRLSNRSLPDADSWRDELAPYMPGGAPRAPIGWEWSYGHDAAGPWFCFSAAEAEGRPQSLRKAADAFPPGTITVSNACAAPEGATDGAAATYRPTRS
jgi:hypothetical protein